MNPVVSQLRAGIGQERLSDWLLIEEMQIRRFNQLVGGFTKIGAGAGDAHPYQLLSLLPKLLESVPFDQPSGVRFGVNYGMDQVQFLDTVHSEAEVRGRFTIADAFEKNPGQIQLITDVTIETKGPQTPVLKCRWITQAYT